MPLLSTSSGTDTGVMQSRIHAQCNTICGASCIWSRGSTIIHWLTSINTYWIRQAACRCWAPALGQIQASCNPGSTRHATLYAGHHAVHKISRMPLLSTSSGTDTGIMQSRIHAPCNPESTRHAIQNPRAMQSRIHAPCNLESACRAATATRGYMQQRNHSPVKAASQ